MTAQLMINFNGNTIPLHSLLADISSKLYSYKDGLNIMNSVAQQSSDETDCRNTKYGDNGTCTDGRVGPQIYQSRLEPKRMIYEVNRLETFKTWSETNPVRPTALARAGFYFIGVHDIVKCFSCEGQIQDFEFGDTAMGEHSRHYPNCDFVKNIDKRNVPLVEMNEKPEFERKLKGRIEQSQREIEERAKEKEALLLRDQVSMMSGSSSEYNTTTGSSSTASANETEDERMTIEDDSMPLFGQYHKEYVRLKSFRNWPRTNPIEPRDLARAGFYYKNDDDSVQCFACYGQISKWKPCDVPAVEHKTHFPNCPFVQGLDVGNEPISTPPDFNVGLPTPKRSVSAPLPTLQQQMIGKELQRQGSAQLRAHLGPLHNCRHPGYMQEDTRLRTFNNWPTNLGIQASPRILARAGFFYTGSADECKCFYCDGGLKNWEPLDEPWTEHAKWFPRCEWLIQQRGQSFITHVQRVNPPPVGTMDKYRPEGQSEQDYPWTHNNDEFTEQEMQFSSPSIGREEPFFKPPHTLHTSYEERTAPLGTVTTVGMTLEGPRQKEMTIEDEKAAAHREFQQRRKEPEAAAEINFKQSPKAEAAKRSSPKLGEEKNQLSSVDDVMNSPTTQMAIEMGYDEKLIRYVIAAHMRKTGKVFASPEVLLEAIWAAEKEDIDPSILDQYSTSLSSRAAGGYGGDDDSFVPTQRKKFLDSEVPSSSSSFSASIDQQVKKLAGLSINDEPSDNDRMRQINSSSLPTPRALSPQTLTSSEALEDKQLCKICLDRELNTVFMPCKHLATCSECASKVRECPMCRQAILDSFQVFMP